MDISVVFLLDFNFTLVRFMFDDPVTFVVKKTKKKFITSMTIFYVGFFIIFFHR